MRQRRLVADSTPPMQPSNKAFLLALALGSCQRPYQSSDSTWISSDSTYVVLSLESTRTHWATFRGCDGAGTSGLQPGWVPDSTLAARLDRVMRPMLDSLLASQATRAADYRIQYAGAVSAGQRVVLVNGFHSRLIARIPALPDGYDPQTYRKSWYEIPLVPCDVGNDHFRALLDSTGNLVGRVRFGSPF